MVQKISFIIVFIMLSVSLLQAQKREQLEIFNSGFTQGALSLWNQEKTTAAYYYPAEADYDNIGIYCSIGKWANSIIVEDMNSNGQYVLPSFVSIGIPVGNFMISVGYNNYYNARIHYSFPVSTVGNPYGTGETSNGESKTKLHVFFNSVKYEVNKNLSLGILLGLNVLSESHEIFNSALSGDGYGFSLKAGLLWKPTRSLLIGFNYNFISSIDYVIKNESASDLKYKVDVPGDNEYVLVETEFKRKGSFPLSYGVKVGYKIQPNINLDLSLERETWDFIETDENSVFNIRFRSSFRVHEKIVLNVGYFTQNNPFWNGAISYSLGNLYKNLQYFSVGVDYLITDSIVFNLSLFDSNQLSRDKSGQTYFSSAISIEL